MCETHGVTKDQYDDARLTAHWSVIQSWYANFGSDSADDGCPQPSAEEIAVANDRIQRYHTAHSDRGLTRDELAAHEL